MSEVIPFPPARRLDLVWRQAHRMAELSHPAAERHLQRQVQLQREVLTSKGVCVKSVDQACCQYEGAIRSALWRLVLLNDGAA